MGSSEVREINSKQCANIKLENLTEKSPSHQHGHLEIMY